MRARRSAPAIVGDLLLWLAAVGGAICIALAVAAWGFGITLIMFKTGSMSPTIPTGSVAVVQQVPASAVAVGDVVTVDRPGQLPVTHRVTSIDGSGDARTITMRGDANAADDPAPYVVERVRKVLFSVPGIADVVVWFQNPFVLGALTLGASALVTWMFWPRRDARSAPRGRRRAAVARGISGTAAVLALAVTAAIAPAPPAQAAWLNSERASGTFKAMTTQPVPTVTCNGPFNNGMPITWTAPATSRAPSRYYITWSGGAGSGEAVVTGTSYSIPGTFLSLGGSSVVRVYARWGTTTNYFQSAQSLQTRTITTVSVAGIVVSRSCA